MDACREAGGAAYASWAVWLPLVASCASCNSGFVRLSLLPLLLRSTAPPTRGKPGAKPVLGTAGFAFGAGPENGAVEELCKGASMSGLSSQQKQHRERSTRHIPMT